MKKKYLITACLCWVFLLVGNDGFSQGLSITGTVDATNLTITGTIQGGTYSGTFKNGIIGVSALSATGTPTATTYLRGDNTWATIAGGGSVTTVSVVTANGISGTVSNPTTTPAITLSLGAISPASVNASGGITGTTIGGTLTTASQPNITTLGSLGTITVTGNATLGNLSLTGTGVAATVAQGDSSANIATTAYVDRQSFLRKVVLTSDVSNNTTSFADVTGLSFSVTANITYHFRVVIYYTSAAAATGSKWSCNGPTFDFLSYVADYANAATTRTNYNGATYNVGTASLNSTTLNGLVATIEGLIIPNASGTLTITFGSEIASSAITAKAGSYLQYW